MRVPIHFETKFYTDDVTGLEIQDFTMEIKNKIHHPTDGITIIPTKGPRMTLFEVYSIATAKKLKEYQLDTMNEFELASVVRKALLESLEEASKKGHHVFSALIDKPKRWIAEQEKLSQPKVKDILEQELESLKDFQVEPEYDDEQLQPISQPKKSIPQPIEDYEEEEIVLEPATSVLDVDTIPYTEKERPIPKANAYKIMPTKKPAPIHKATKQTSTTIKTKSKGIPVRKGYIEDDGRRRAGATK